MDTHERVAQPEQREGEALVGKAQEMAKRIRWGNRHGLFPPDAADTLDSLADALAASQRKADEAIQAHTSLTETYKKVARERDDAEDALAASQEKLERANEDRREVQRVLQAQLQASQEKERQLREALRWARFYFEEATTDAEFAEAEGRFRAALDSTQTHGGSDA